jgi:hypothetical protein
LRVMDNGRQWRHARHELCGARPDDVVGSHQGGRTYAALPTISHYGRIRFGGIDPRPLAAARAKESLMQNPKDSARIVNSYRYETPGERVHDSGGRVHDEASNSPGPTSDGSAEPAKFQHRGFMVPRRGVHDCCTAAVIAGPAQIEPTAARALHRSLAPSMRRIFGEPTAAERRPERRGLLGIALRSPSLTWWGRYSVTSLSQQTLDFANASLPRRLHLFGINPPHSDRTGKKDGEPVGLTDSRLSATIMKVNGRHEAKSKEQDRRPVLLDVAAVPLAHGVGLSSSFTRGRCAGRRGLADAGRPRRRRDLTRR